MTLIVGLTGGIGSGKSAVAAEFARYGVPIVDTDAIAHELSATGAAGQRAVAERFGPRALARDGSLDRAWLRAQAFADPAFRAALESVLHPLIAAESRRRVALWREPYGILVVPLLLERGRTRELVDRVLVVDCEEATQLRRAMARSRLTAPEARSIMAAQMPRDDRLAQADDVIDNNGPLEAIAPQVAALDAHYRGLAQRARHGEASPDRAE